MRILTRGLPVALATLLLLLAACTGGGGGTTSDQPADGDLVSAAPLEVLTASADSFQQDVQSLQAELDFNVQAGGFPLGGTADMAFQSPDQAHVTMNLGALGSFEMLMLGQEIYINIPGQGWVVLSVEDLLGGVDASQLGVDAESFQNVLSDHSFVDYQTLIDNLGADVEDLGEETLDGATFRHFRGTLDFAAVAAAFSDAFGATDSLGLDTVSGPLTFDAWLDPETFLPHEITASGEFAFGADSMTFDATMRFFGYNEPVEIPGAPADAVPFSELLAGLLQ
jgi:hypothetical protein